LKNIRRYRVLNPKYEIKNNLLLITPAEIHKIEKHSSGVDYIVEYDNTQYLLPEETLLNNSIPIEKIDKWQYFNLKTIIK